MLWTTPHEHLPQQPRVSTVVIDVGQKRQLCRILGDGRVFRAAVGGWKHEGAVV